MKKVLSTLLAATLLLTTVTGLQGLSVSAEDSAAAGTSNELIANGDFEGADTVLLEEDFEDSDVSDWQLAGRGDVKTKKQSTDDNESNIALNVINIPATKLLDVGPGNYTLSCNVYNTTEIAEDNVSTARFYAFVTSSNVLNNSTDAVWKIFNAGTDFLGKLNGSARDYYQKWTTISFNFTVPENCDKVYINLASNWPNVCIDDVKVVKEYVAPNNTVKGYSVVSDPDDADNHCMKLSTWNVPYVDNFAVESNTYYKVSYSYKSVANADYTSKKDQQLYCKILNSENVQLAVYDTNGEAIKDNAFGIWSSNLNAVTQWKDISYVFKTGAVSPDTTYKFQMTVTGGPMYADNFSVTKLVSDTAVQADFDFLGTAIRATSADVNNQQLRFKAQVNKAALAAGYYNGFTITEYGFLAFRKDYLANQDSPLTLNVDAQKGTETKKVAAVKKEAYLANLEGTASTDIVFTEDETTKQFHARLTGFTPETNYDKTYLVRTYAKLKNADGVELTVYLSGTEGLGVYDLAFAALNNSAEKLETRQTMWDLLNKSESYKDKIGSRPEA